jgi:hypothetical protein
VSASRCSAGNAPCIGTTSFPGTPSKVIHFAQTGRRERGIHLPGGTDMSPEEIRANAAQCRRWAEQAKHPENRKVFYELAAAWEQSALRIERTAGRLTPLPAQDTLRRRARSVHAPPGRSPD